MQRIAEWARSRWEHGLGGPGYPWQEGEEGWLVAGQLQAQAEEGQAAGGFGGFGAAAPDHDVPAAQLADPDSRWAQCGGLRVHYKLALPLASKPPVPAWQHVPLHAVLIGLGPWHTTAAAPPPDASQGRHSTGDAAVVLVHPFGGGTFCWRHMQQPLADGCGLPVLSFDRPGFGARGCIELPSAQPALHALCAVAAVLRASARTGVPLPFLQA